MTDQVEAQGEKMRELEFTLEEQKIKAEDLEQELKKVSWTDPLFIWLLYYNHVDGDFRF